MKMPAVDGPHTKMASLFEWLDAINTGKQITLDEDESFKDYAPFQINNGLSQNLDTVLIANEMNKRPWLSKEMQYKFFLHAVLKKKRYGKWAKAETEVNKEDIEIVSEYYCVNHARATEYLKLIKPHELEYMRNMNNKGGAEMNSRSKKK